MARCPTHRLSVRATCQSGRTMRIGTRQLRANTRPHLRRNPCNPCSAGRVELGFGLETPQPVGDLAAAAVGPGLFQDA